MNFACITYLPVLPGAIVGLHVIKVYPFEETHIILKLDIFPIDIPIYQHGGRRINRIAGNELCK
jgi:hypothetical protein